MKILLLCLTTLPALIQQTHPAVVKTAIARKAFTADTPPEERAEEITNGLLSSLDLTPAQVPKVRAIALANAIELQAMLRKFRSGEPVDPRQESIALNEQFENKLAVVLTPAQNKHRQAVRASFRRAMLQGDSTQQARNR